MLGRKVRRHCGTEGLFWTNLGAAGGGSGAGTESFRDDGGGGPNYFNRAWPRSSMIDAEGPFSDGSHLTRSATPQLALRDIHLSRDVASTSRPAFHPGWGRARTLRLHFWGAMWGGFESTSAPGA